MDTVHMLGVTILIAINQGNNIHGREDTYKPATNSTEVLSTSQILHQFDARSKIHCHVSCSSTESCVSASYDLDNRKCYLYGDVIVGGLVVTSGSNVAVMRKTLSDYCYHGGTMVTTNRCECVYGMSGRYCQTRLLSIINNAVTLSTDNGVNNWGYWTSPVYCPNRMFASGFIMQFLADQGWNGDDIGVSRLTLVCSSVEVWSVQTQVISIGEDWGTWTPVQMCPVDYYLVAFQQLVDPDSGGLSDDWGVSNFNFLCRGPGLHGTDTQYINGQNAGTSPDWGSWGTYSTTCGSGQAICTMKSRVVDFWGNALHQDDVAMINMHMNCCGF